MTKYSVGDIENILFEAFPLSDALPNDRNGLFVGDRKTIVKKIAVALDQTLPMIETALAFGCNLLVTHHPPFMYAPDSFLNVSSPALSNGAVIYKAAQKGIALLNMHTNLDCAPAARNMMFEPVGLEYTAPLRPYGTGALGQLGRVQNRTKNNPTPLSAEDSGRGTPSYLSLQNGLGPLSANDGCRSPEQSGDRGYLQLGELFARYRRYFGGVAKVWGDPDRPIFTVAACSGGAGEVVNEVVAAGVDCFITGEVRHHEALYLADAGISLIELGHDNSEMPYRYILQNTLVVAGIPYCDIVVLSPSATWWHPVADARE
ncbi:MAG TPA: hypothetical protein DEB24_05490 [Coriobacteriia bacterium]|nr:hypothetical protein [Coriobacteriia bacterium]